MISVRAPSILAKESEISGYIIFLLNNKRNGRHIGVNKKSIFSFSFQISVQSNFL